jgi:hypothetical protein
MVYTTLHQCLQALFCNYVRAWAEICLVMFGDENHVWGMFGERVSGPIVWGMFGAL